MAQSQPKNPMAILRTTKTIITSITIIILAVVLVLAISKMEALEITLTTTEAVTMSAVEVKADLQTGNPAEIPVVMSPMIQAITISSIQRQT